MRVLLDVFFVQMVYQLLLFMSKSHSTGSASQIWTVFNRALVLDIGRLGAGLARHDGDLGRLDGNGRPGGALGEHSCETPRLIGHGVSERRHWVRSRSANSGCVSISHRTDPGKTSHVMTGCSEWQVRHVVRNPGMADSLVRAETLGD